MSLARAALLVLLGGLVPAIPASAAKDTIVFAAASLADALDALVRQYRAATGENVRVSYAASSVLAKQLENGAPAGVYVSADMEWMDYAAKHRLVRSDTRVNLVRNELVLVAPAKSTIALVIAPGFPIAQALGNGRLAIADPDHVPAGKYAKAALETLRVWSSVEHRLARADNVRAALVFVARGEAPLGIVYRTDAAADPNVRIVATFPANNHPPIVYPAALTTAATTPEAQRFFEMLKSRAAAEMFRKFGFVPYAAEAR